MLFLLVLLTMPGAAVHDCMMSTLLMSMCCPSAIGEGIVKEYVRGDDRNLPCFCMTERNLMTTLDEGRTSTWRLPLRSALTMELRASFYGRRGVRGNVRKLSGDDAMCGGDGYLRERRCGPWWAIM